ncbi:hypothetical protein D3C81_1899040 [compost metagenome]
MASADVGDFAFAQIGFEDAVQRSFVRFPRLGAPVQIVINIEGRAAQRCADAKEIRRRIQLVALDSTFQGGALFARAIHPLSVRRQTPKAGINQAACKAQGVALHGKITVDAAIFLAPQPALRAAQL